MCPHASLHVGQIHCPQGMSTALKKQQSNPERSHGFQDSVLTVTFLKPMTQSTHEKNETCPNQGHLTKY